MPDDKLAAVLGDPASFVLALEQEGVGRRALPS